MASVAPTTSRSVLLNCRSKICFASGVASAARIGNAKRAIAVKDRITVIGPPVYRFSSAGARSWQGYVAIGLLFCCFDFRREIGMPPLHAARLGDERYSGSGQPGICQCVGDCTVLVAGAHDSWPFTFFLF